jgi:hypothetical protein
MTTAATLLIVRSDSERDRDLDRRANATGSRLVGYRMQELRFGMNSGQGDDEVRDVLILGGAAERDRLVATVLTPRGGVLEPWRHPTRPAHSARPSRRPRSGDSTSPARRTSHAPRRGASRRVSHEWEGTIAIARNADGTIAGPLRFDGGPRQVRHVAAPAAVFQVAGALTLQHYLHTMSAQLEALQRGVQDVKDMLVRAQKGDLYTAQRFVLQQEQLVEDGTKLGAELSSAIEVHLGRVRSVYSALRDALRSSAEEVVGLVDDTGRIIDHDAYDAGLERIMVEGRRNAVTLLVAMDLTVHLLRLQQVAALERSLGQGPGLRQTALEQISEMRQDSVTLAPCFDQWLVTDEAIAAHASGLRVHHEHTTTRRVLSSATTSLRRLIYDGIARLGVSWVVERAAHSLLYLGTPVLEHDDEAATPARRFTFRQPVRRRCVLVRGAVTRRPSSAPGLALVVAVADTDAPMATIDAERPDRAAVPRCGSEGRRAAPIRARCQRGSRHGSVAGGQRVDGDGDREDERDVLARRNVDAIGVPHSKPLLGDRGDRVAVALDLVLVVDDVAVRFHVGAVLDVDSEAISDPDQRLVDGRGGVASALDGDLVADAELALLDPGNLASGAIFENEGLSQANRLAVDLVSPFAAVVLDPEVIADRQQLLAHEKPLAPGRILPMPMETHLPTV